MEETTTMNGTDEAGAVHFDLQRLTMSDPAARDNMMRYIAAFRTLLTGRQQDSEDLKVMIGAGFGITDASEVQHQFLTAADGCDRLFIRFDVDDAAGPPDGLGLFRKEGGAVSLYGQCRLWSPPSGGRPIIIFYHERRMGHFAYRPGKTLRRVDRLPTVDLMPGYLRADARLASLVASDLLREVGPAFVAMIAGGHAVGPGDGPDAALRGQH
jgi:hypothetical protein